MVASILVGVDDSDSATAALRWAADFIRSETARGRELRGVAVAAWSPVAISLAGMSGLVQADVAEQAAQASLERALGRLDDPEIFAPVVQPGPPADVLLDEADRHDCELIVIGSRGRGALTKLLLGSVSRSVAARSHRPVVIIPHEAAWSDGSTVVGYDGSDGADAALAWAVANGDGPIVAVSAWHLPTDALYHPDSIDIDGFEAQIRERLESAIAALAPEDRPRVSAVVERDDPRLALLGQADRAARIVLGARAHHGLRGLLLGSTVDYVASHSTRPVVVVPPPPRAS